MMKKRILKFSLVFIALLFVFVCSAVVWIHSFPSHESNKQNREALIRIFNKLDLGNTEQSVRNIYNEHKTNDLGLSTDDRGEWCISMPYEFGSTDWRIYLTFEKSHLTKAMIRTMDGPKPNGSPDDKTVDINTNTEITVVGIR